MAGEEIESINDEYRYFFVVLQGKISLSRVSWAVGKRGFERVLPRLEKRETRGVGAGDCWGEERLNEEMRNRSGSFSSVNSKFVSEVSVAQDRTEVLMLDVRVRSPHCADQSCPVHANPCSVKWTPRLQEYGELIERNGRIPSPRSVMTSRKGSS